MKINLNQNKNLKLFKLISEVASDTNQNVFIVGGFVRDLLMSRKAPTDIDFVTESNGITLAKSVADVLKPAPKVSIFKNYGTAMFKYNGLDLEFVGARKESYAEDSRNPSVEIGNLDDDQKRRDFTINALAIFALPQKGQASCPAADRPSKAAPLANQLSKPWPASHCSA